MAKAETAEANLNFARMSLFSLTTIPVQGLFMLLTVYLPAYFATSIAVPLTVVAAVFATCRTIDIPLGPVVGAIMDRTRTHFGRYRLWIVIGAPVLSLGLFMLLRAAPGVSSAYMIVWLMVMYLGQTIVGLSHSAWTGKLAKTYEQRARLFAFTLSFGTMGAMALLVIPVITGQLGHSETYGVRAMIMFLAVIAPITAIVVAMTTPETVAVDQHKRAAFSLRDYLDVIIRPTMRRLLLADVCFILAPAWMSAMIVFFNRDRLSLTAEITSAFLGVSLVSGIIGAQLSGFLAGRFGKPCTAGMFAVVMILGSLSLAFVPRGMFLAALPGYIAHGFAGIAFIALIRSMLADAAEEILVDQGKEQSGLLFSLINVTQHAGSALAIIVTFPLLEYVGYDPTLADGNTPAAIGGLTLVYLSGPIVLTTMGALSLIGYPLTPARVAENRRILDAQDLSGKPLSEQEPDGPPTVVEPLETIA